MTDNTYALYRKYRPEQFSDVRNQDHIISVLKGAIKQKTIPHALLFTGSRGTGKTSVARIFAHEIGAKDVDIYEIDGASNRGVDDIRALREAVLSVPYESPYKVYIIDEVHMLTKEAFNALLKTLEEPPSHVIFILATTEKDKLLDTITSRCQTFEFHAPGREELREAILAVAKKEKFKLEVPAADIIALSAEGSYRDALGVMQKVMMASLDSVLSVDEVAEVVGAPQSVLIQDILTAFATKNVEQGLQALEQVRATNVDIKLFYRLFMERIRSVMIVRNIKNAQYNMDTFTKEEQELILSYAEDVHSPINSRLLLRAIALGEFVGKSFISTLPIELLLLEHCE